MTRFGEHNIACGQIIVNSDSLGSRLLVLDLVQVLKVTLVTATGILCLQFYCFKSLPFGLLLDNLEVLSRSSTYPIQKDWRSWALWAGFSRKFIRFLSQSVQGLVLIRFLFC